MFNRAFFIILFLLVMSVQVIADEFEADSTKNKRVEKVSEIIKQVSKSGKDTLIVNYKDVSMSFTGDDLRSISWGRNVWTFTNMGVVYNKNPKRCHRKFNGHWAGVAISVNGYMSGPFDINMPTGYDFMGLRYEKSAGVYLNFFEVNFTLARFKNGYFGAFTGLGYEFHNYRFQNNVMINMYKGNLEGYRVQNALGDDVMKKSKLEVEYVTAPIIFEYQYIGKRKVNDFHIGVGVVVGVTTFSHTKVKFYQPNTNYQIVDYATGSLVDSRMTGGSLVYKNRYLGLNPFKCDIIATVGFAGLNFFVTHSVTNMFKSNSGVKLYPWSVGVILLGW